MDKNNFGSNCINCGIRCSVEKCVHHTKDDCCTVDTVNIGKRSADCCEDTVCASFKANKQ